MKLISKWLDLKMTGNIAPVPLVASSFLNATDNYYPFDGNLNNYTYLKDTNTSTGWLKIDLGVGTIVNKCNIKFKIDDMPNSLNVEGSNDNTIFEMLHSIDPVIGNIQEFSFENSIPYRYYRLNVAGTDYVGVHEWQLGQNIIEYDERLLLKSNNKNYSFKPTITKHETKMTSNTTPAPFVASTSSANSAYPAWRVFNGVFNSTGDDSWNTASGVTNAWIQIDYSTPRKVNVVVLKNRWLSNASSSTTPYTSPKDFDILGSNDGINFRLLKSERGLAKWKNGEVKTFTLNTVANFRYYRVHILNGNNDSGNASYNVVSLAEIEFLYVEALTELPIGGLNNFISYGANMSDSQYFSLTHGSKNYILSTTDSVGADGLWVQELDRKPLSIKFE